MKKENGAGCSGSGWEQGGIQVVKEKNRGCKTYGWILYTQDESIRNRRYIDFYQAACPKYGMAIELVICEPAYLMTADATARLAELVRREQPAFAVNRTRSWQLAKMLEALGIRVYNNSMVAEIGNDKAKAYRYMQQHGIPILPTAYGVADIPVRFPVVVKSCGGHGGTEVFFIKNVSEWGVWKKDTYDKEKGYVVQQPASELGADLRVYVVGNRIAASVLRTSATDFRSNACLGGDIQLYELSAAQRQLVETIISKFDIGMAGVDFLFDHGQMVFNEIEDMAGARMLYALTDYDIVDDYVKYISRQL